ncbi:hypothetical protein PG991_000762 [Apiospora marii]|uniref:Uncharacterized protein n=1 Tax=Apiospora marii TaxID=335849 RepID=A0ABR1SU99_9PEZI
MAMIEEWLGSIPSPESPGSFESGLDIDGAGRSGTSAPRWTAFRFSSARGNVFHERRAMLLCWAFYLNPALTGLLKELTTDFELDQSTLARDIAVKDDEDATRRQRMLRF